MDMNVIQPVKDTDDLFESRPYLTRLYTTLNAEEMTVDPAFGYNNGLGDLDNLHTATRIIECNATVNIADAPWRALLPQGTVVRGAGATWPVETEDVPAALHILQYDREGPGEVLVDNKAKTDEILKELPSARACACAAAPRGRTGAYAGLGLFMLTLGVLRRRRR